MSQPDPKQLADFCGKAWDDSILPELIEYIRIPNKSPVFDPDWSRNGHMDKVVAQFERWIRSRDVKGLTLEVVRLNGRTPLIYMEIPGNSEGTVLLYGHLDKQPEMSGWRSGLGPWQPVVEGDKLYGRGGADDGYATFASVLAIEALHKQGIAHARCVIIIEACEESGSIDLPFYIDALADRIGEPELVVCLDSGCGNYEQLWCTTSLRGLAGGELRVEILKEGVHSGDAGGVVPCSFRLLRQLLERVEDGRDGRVLLDACHVEIPAKRIDQAQKAAQVLGGSVSDRFPFVPGAGPDPVDGAELILNRTWRPALSVIGMDGVPPPADAGNVLRPFTSAKLSMRLPPTADPARAAAALKEMLERDPPNRARVTFKSDWNAAGWHAPNMMPWLEQAVSEASQRHFGRPAMHMGEGGTIPFMGMLGEKFPEAQFLITGLLGPGSNAHGPNEFIHLPTAKRLTCCVADIIAAHADNTPKTRSAA